MAWPISVPRYCANTAPKLRFPTRLVKHPAGILMQLTLQYPRSVAHGKEWREPFLGNEEQTRNKMNNPRTRESGASRTTPVETEDFTL